MSQAPRLRAVADLKHAEADHDALVVLAPTPVATHLPEGPARASIERALAVDATLAKGPRPPVVLPSEGVAGGRVVLASMGPLTDETEDVRLYAEAASAAIARAVDAGARHPLLHVAVPAGASARFVRATEVAALAAMGSQWIAVEAREAGKAPPTAESIGVVGLSADRVAHLTAIEAGKRVCRDITGTEPERMTPMRVAALCEEAFGGTGVEVAIERDLSRYPLLSAVARASNVVERHRPCVVRLEIRPEGEVTRTIVLAGKGVTYDTGGADLKTDGAMAGMSRDKGGAGAVAGLLRALASLKVPGLRVVGLLGLVRNSIGEESFVSDEIIKARSGVRVRIGNTDAEGRLVLGDLLARAKELVEGAPSPAIFSIATLTGHVYRAFGPYVGAICNAAARDGGHLDRLDALGEQWGEPLERSRPRREDYAFVAARSACEDVVSANRLASVATPRGHQYPFAFLDIVSGLRGGTTPFVHLDIAGAAVEPADWQFGRPTGSPISTLTHYCVEGPGSRPKSRS